MTLGPRTTEPLEPLTPRACASSPDRRQPPPLSPCPLRMPLPYRTERRTGVAQSEAGPRESFICFPRNVGEGGPSEKRVGAPSDPAAGPRGIRQHRFVRRSRAAKTTISVPRPANKTPRACGSALASCARLVGSAE